MPVRHKMIYFFGVITPVAPAWYASSFVGAMVGTTIPPEYALDFALPITFIAMIAPMLRTIAHMAAALTSVGLALVLTWMPYSTGLLVAALGALLVGAEVERQMERRRA